MMPAIRESIPHGMDAQRKELGYAEAPLRERLLIDQVVLTWLHLYKTQYRYDAIRMTPGTFQRGLYWARRLNAVQRRHLWAVETLARVRKLSGRAVIQIYIAEQQVDVAA